MEKLVMDSKRIQLVTDSCSKEDVFCLTRQPVYLLSVLCPLSPQCPRPAKSERHESGFEPHVGC